MTNFMDQLRVASAGGLPVGVMQMPSQAQRDELERAKAVQVRLAAADMATKLLAGKAPNTVTWLAKAKMIEGYILGDEPAAGPPPRLAPGQATG